MANLLLLLAAALILYKTTTKIVSYISYQRKKKHLGCSEPQSRYPHKEPFLGIDLIIREQNERTNGTHLESIQQQFRDHGRTHEINFLGGRMIRTMGAENIQAVLGVKADDYGLEPLRNGLAEPLFGRGINTTDGEYWQYSRSLIKPTFNRVDICNFESLEAHFQKLLGLLPENGTTVDLQPLFSKLFLDTSTEFLFGRSADTLSSDPSSPGQNFVESWDSIMHGLGLRVRLGPAKFLHRDPVWFQSIRNVHAFVEKHIDEALAGADDKVDVFKRHYVLLREMAKITQDKLDLRSQIMAVFMPSRDTTTHLMTNIFWSLARRPDVYEKVRRSVLDISPTEPLNFDQLRSLKYLQWVINETHRMYAVSSDGPRAALTDSVLPTGGGPSGSSPILVCKGDLISFNMYCLHHDPEFWGEDHDTFRPERWDGLRPLWHFIPFGGGPRTCPAQAMVNTEALYVASRMVQIHEKLGTKDERPWTEAWFLGPYNRFGCEVVLEQ